MKSARWLTAALTVLTALTAMPAQPDRDKDYSTELPRILPKEPADALKTFQLRPGFKIELVAAEPLLRSPVAMDFDENGRLFVAEYPEYNQYASKKPHGKGCIRLLEDPDENGRYRKSTIYADNLDSPVAVACWDGGVFVGCVPDILYFKDTRGDGKADVRKVVYTGFGRDAAGEAMMNSFRWGLENRFVLSTSLAGGGVRRADQKEARPLSVRGQGFIFDPRSLDFEVTSGGGQHGMSLDDYGRMFVCGNSDPIHLVMYDGRYLARNPYVQAPAAAINVAPEGKYTKLFRISPNEPWRVLRTRLRKEGVVPGSDEGGQPSGFFTGATGVTIYRGDAWPEEYRGNAFVGEVAGNLVYRAKLEPSGLELTASRADANVEFLASSDNWFRPVQFAHGPDGCLYVIDMYRELIEGAAFLPPMILKHLDPSSGVERGRIWRLVPEKFERRKPPQLGKASTVELVALLEHSNGWHRDTASRLLYQRQDRGAIAPLRKLTGSASPLGRMHTLYALAGLDALTPADLLPRLEDEDARVRIHALRLAERLEAAPAIRAALEKRLDDPDRGVRYQLAWTLGLVKGEMSARLLAKLAVRDGADRWARLAVLTSSAGRAGELFGLLAAEKDFRRSAHGKQMLAALAAQVGGANRPDEVAALVRALDGLPEDEKALSQEVVRSLASRLPPKAREQLAALTSGRTPALLADLLRDARKIAADDKQPTADRAAAVRTLALASFTEVRDLFPALLTLRQPAPVQAAALEVLGRFDSPDVAGIVLVAWTGLSPKLRATAAETLLSRPAWIHAFLDAVEKGKVARGDIDPARVQLLQAHADKGIRERTAKVFAGTGLARRQDVFEKYRPALKLDGDRARGKMVFKTHCSACHRLEGVGEAIGEDLKAIRDRGLEAVMLNILDPNREVKPQYLTYYVSTTAGRTLTGMITAETATGITVRRPDGTSETLLRVDIDELRSTGLSFMPEGLEKQIDLQAMADLLAYLDSIR
jgi:putative membrane-bound dehydrogenase-like protein